MAKKPAGSGKRGGGRKPRNKATSAPEPETGGAADDTMLYPQGSLVKSLIKAKKAAKSNTSAIAGEVGEKIAKAVEASHLDRKALNIVAGLDALPNERLLITWNHMLRYAKDIGLEDRVKEAGGETFFEESDMGDGHAERSSGSVIPIGTAAARAVAEAAGQN